MTAAMTSLERVLTTLGHQEPDRVPLFLLVVDVRGNILEANGQAQRVMGKGRDEIVGSSIDDVYGAAIQQAVRSGMDELLRCGAFAIAGIRIARPGGEDVIVDANFALVEAAGRRIIQGIFRDVSERERSARELQTLSLTDALTGLRNRCGFEVLAEQEIKTAGRLGRPLLLLFADVDGLKPVNDIQGHAAGDLLLRGAVDVLASCFRDMDVVARVGGDEFVVLQAEAGADAAAAAAQRLDEAVAAVNAAPSRTFRLSLSLGAATFDPAEPCTLDELMSRADERMYAAKRARKVARGGGSGRA